MQPKVLYVTTTTLQCNLYILSNLKTNVLGYFVILGVNRDGKMVTAFSNAITKQTKTRELRLNLVSKVAVSYAVIMVVSTILKQNASRLFVWKDLSEAKWHVFKLDVIQIFWSLRIYMCAFPYLNPAAVCRLLSICVRNACQNLHWSSRKHKEYSTFRLLKLMLKTDLI